MKLFFLIIIFFITLSCSPSSPKESTLLEKYMLTHDWKLRIKIRELSGEQEIIQTRIFEAFEIYKFNHAPYDNEQILDNARNELFRNPDLTTATLYPMLFETFNEDELKEHDLETYPEVSQLKKEQILNLILNFATIELKPKIIKVLEKLAESDDDNLSKKSKEYLIYARKHHWLIYKTKYNLKKNYFDLQWLQQKMLHYQMPEENIKLVLGEPDIINLNHWYYLAKIGSEQEYLKVTLRDTFFKTSTWVDTLDFK